MGDWGKKQMKMIETRYTIPKNSFVWVSVLVSPLRIKIKQKWFFS